MTHNNIIIKNQILTNLISNIEYIKTQNNDILQNLEAIIQNRDNRNIIVIINVLQNNSKKLMKNTKELKN